MATQDAATKKTAGKPKDESVAETPLADAPCFIEQQFPVARISAESYKERKANYSQTLTGLGKWWGRKPLVLVRATILGVLLPSTDDPKRDRAVFLRLMTMDADGLRRRKNKSIPGKRLMEELRQMPPSVQKRFIDFTTADKPALQRLNHGEREELQCLVFDRMPYSEKQRYSLRPEQIDGPSQEAWTEINTHLGTNARSLPELIEELGRLRFGHRPRVADSFCGAGSLPFEAARIGCDTYGSDLSPVAALLTWASLNIVGGGEQVARRVEDTQRDIFDLVDRQVTEWGIEHNSKGWRADAYLYCVEVSCPECAWKVPLAPSWVLAEKTKTVAELVSDDQSQSYQFRIHRGASSEQMKQAKETATVRDSRLWCPHCGQDTPISVVRRRGTGKDPRACYHESGLRLWENGDVVPRPDDVFQERLYCIRWVETYWDTNADGEQVEKTRRHYCAVTEDDLEREELALVLLRERFVDWQTKGYLPSRRIEPGYNTSQPIRERGWTCWHHLFTPRQLLLYGLLLEAGFQRASQATIDVVSLLLGVGRCADYSAKLSRWAPQIGYELTTNVFSNQALNTVLNPPCRGLSLLRDTFALRFKPSNVQPVEQEVQSRDGRAIGYVADLWITDPPYADAINYHELGEFFLAWYEKHLPQLFSGWYADSKRALAVKADDLVEFRKSMVDCYGRLVEHMPNNGVQVVMFTHQDAAVWADLTMILWAAGLRVTAAWCIATETDTALKQGNYVQGTVLLVCRKRTEGEPVFLDEINHRVESEVRRQLDEMLELDDDSDPNFADADYQLAAYAAALRVLTERPIEEIDPEREITRVRPTGEVGPVERLIRNAVKIACDHLVPQGIDREVWKTLTPLERFYLKGLEVETHGEHRSGVYQELARGFGAADYDDLLQSDRANKTRLKTASEFGRRMLSGEGFASSKVRQVLFATHEITRTEETANGLNWLKTELPDYWNAREELIEVLDCLGRLDRIADMDHWKKDSESARLLAGAVRNDHV